MRLPRFAARASDQVSSLCLRERRPRVGEPISRSLAAQLTFVASFGERFRRGRVLYGRVLREPDET